MSTELATTRADKIAVHDSGEFANLLDTAKFEHLWRVATAFSKSTMVPTHFQGSPENVFIAIQMAFRCGVDPFTFLQNCYIVHGRPGIETKLAIALLNRSNVSRGSVKYRVQGSGKTLQCTAYVTEALTGEVLEHTLTWATVEAEGWTKKSGSKWLTDPQVMIQYRAAMRLIRLHFPEVLLGMYSKEELDDMNTLEGEGKVVSSKPVATITQRLEARHPVDKPHLPQPVKEEEHGDAWEPDEEEAAQIEQRLFETHPDAAEA
jgi:hypothetical protein